MPSQFELLGAARVTGILQGLQDPRLLPQQLVWSNRIPDTPATDEEIMARFIGQVQIADMIADDAKAVTYSLGKFQYETNKIPNLKVGVQMNQHMLNQLEKLQTYNFAGQDGDMFNGMMNRQMQAVNLGIRQRKEALFVAMLIDGFSYSRLGIQMSNVTWGMPADLKVTVGTDWSNTGATPVNDMLTVKLVARVRYGAYFNRVTMSTTAFRYMIATTEFQTKAKLYIPPQLGGSYAAFQLLNLEQQIPIAEQVTGMSIELYDARYWSQDGSGNVTSTPFLPVTSVILTDKGNDGDRMAYDFANGRCTESIVASLGTTSIIGGSVPQGFGPIAFTTPASADLNPPGVTTWGVARGWPRKMLLQASAALTVGSFADSITVGVPFPS